ncbi:MAG: SLC13 family permease [Lachnospiraceae bacterium]|nr:anion permease [Cuneatibacter sp.]MDD6456686.1 SLC13 family permease [Lachnospiraceae bacterium]
MKHIIQTLKKETVLCVAALLAVLSMFFIPPDAVYGGYLDYRVLALLFCLMTIMQGFQRTGLFAALGNRLLRRVSTTRQLTLVLVLLCFFTSMWITNDVALLTFVPFTILILKIAGLKKHLIPILCLQTIAANLGSMLTPVGNPQNLYLYSISKMSLMQFLEIMAPLSGISLVVIVILCLLQKQESVEIRQDWQIGQNRKEQSGRNTGLENGILAVLFACSLLSVFRILPWQILLALTLLVCVGISLLCKEVYLPLRADFGLMLTFVAFFVFIGNMGRMEAVRELLVKVLQGRELLLSFTCSQVISNVPAAILLSGFTDQYEALLQGVNIGGLGTLIASLASLISYKFFAAEATEKGEKGRYLLIFTAWNVLLATILLAFTNIKI